MPIVPPWMLGKHVTQVVATIQDVASDGTLTDASTGTFLAGLTTSTGALHSTLAFTQGLVDELEFSASKLTENVSPINRTRAHHVAVAVNYEFTLTEIMRMGSGNTLLAGIWHGGNSSIIKFEFTRARRKWLIYAVLVGLDEGLTRGKNVARLTCRLVDAGSGGLVLSTGADR